jgi:hypothetical protein
MAGKDVFGQKSRASTFMKKMWDGRGKAKEIWY